MKTIRGEAVLDGVPDDIQGATLVIRVEECSRADAPSALILEHRIAGICRKAGNKDPVQFALALPAGGQPLGSEWNVRLQLLRSATDTPVSGDYVSTRRYPLAGARAGGLLRIEMQRVA